MTINYNRKISLAYLAVLVVLCMFQTVNGINIPFFGSFRAHQQPEQKEPRIINADHGGSGGVALSPSSSSSASLAGGNFVSGAGPSWISGTRDQFIRDQLVVLHPDSPLNRDAWKESGYLNSGTEQGFSKDNGVSSVRPPSSPPARIRKPTRKSKQHPTTQTQQQQQQQQETASKTAESAIQNQNNFIPYLPQSTLIPSSGGLYEIAPPPLNLFRDLNNNNDNGNLNSDNNYDPSLVSGAERYLFPANNFLFPYAHPFFSYSPRAIASHSTLPPEAVIQLLKSPEQEMSPHHSRPQVKLPFPLSYDCGGASGSKPLQFVVLPIVEPVAPLKPIFPKPSFLSSQYGQFPYIPPFNLFNKKPPTYPISNLDGSSNGLNQQGQGASGQFVPILNRPAPPLPFVFVQSLPLELIGQNTDMDVLHSSSSNGATSESKINEVTPVAAPPPLPQPSSLQQQHPSTPTPSPTPPPVENAPSPTRPLPLIVIEKVKTPGQPPSAHVGQAAAVVEISKQSVQKSAGGSSGSSPLSTISVVQPITAPGSAPQTPQQQQEIQKAIAKLVPIAASVLENVEQQQKQQKDSKDQGTALPAPSPSTTPVTPNDQGSQVPVTAPPVVEATNNAARQNGQEKSSSLRPSLRPESTQESGVIVAPPPIKVSSNSGVASSVSEEIVGIGVNPTSMTEVEITEA